MANTNNVNLANLSSTDLVNALRERLEVEARAEAAKRLTAILEGSAPEGATVAPAPAPAPKARVAKPAAEKKGSTGPSKDKGKSGLSKSEFIRAYDAEHTAEDGGYVKVKEVIEAAAADGLEVSYALVFNTRKNDTAKAEAEALEAAAAKEKAAQEKAAKKAEKEKAAKKAEKAKEKAAAKEKPAKPAKAEPAAE